jgi:hypothetical protein
MIKILWKESTGSHKVVGIIPLDNDRKMEIDYGACECIEYMTSMSEWLRLISVKEYLTQKYN